MRSLVSRVPDLVPAVEETDPRPLDSLDVRVQVAAAGFTLFDAFVASDHATLGLPDAIGLGFDFAGTVIDIGPEVTGFRVGDRVAGMHDDATAPSRAHASEVVVPAAALAAVPTGLTLKDAASVTLSALTARQALDKLTAAGATPGSLLVTGAAGSVGGWVVALAARDGWKVDALVKPGSEGLVAHARTVLTELPDAAYDALVDAAALQDRALDAVRDGGHVVSLKPAQQIESQRGITVTVVLSRPDGAALTELLPLAATGEAPIRIAAARPLSDAAELYREAAAAPGSAGRWILIP